MFINTRTFILVWIIYEISGENLTDLDHIKRELVINQFRNKLIDHFKRFRIESILTGVSYQGKSRNRNINRILAGIEKIKQIPSAQLQTVNKILVLGVKAKTCRKYGTTCVEFNIPSKLFNSNIRSAKFLITVPRTVNNFVRWNITLDIDDKEIASFNDQSKLSKSGIHEISCWTLLQLFFSKFNKIDNNKKIMKLRIRGQYSGKKLEMKNIYLKTIILLVSMGSPKKRYPRSAQRGFPKNCTTTTIFCCMQTFTVTPADLGLQNLVSPDVIHLNYCRGECNNFTPQRSNHAKYIYLLKRSKNSRLSARQLEQMKSCCTPKSYNSLQIQYREYSNNIMKTLVNDMIVENCGCN